jgi:hypothetical protein
VKGRSSYPDVLIILIMDGVTFYGVGALTFMMLMYAFERRDARFILAFAV